MKPVLIGCGGWNYKGWRGGFYPDDLPQREWLAAYAGQFATVEVNSTFYRLPELAAVEQWVADTPRGFTFAVKGSRYLTHVKRLISFERYTTRFFERIQPLVAAGKLGPVLWQLPKSFRRDDERLAGALEVLAGRPGRHAFEFRHPSWFERPVYERLRDAGVALVIADDPERPFQARAVVTDWTYLRFHAGRGRNGNYPAGELGEWRRRIAAWRSRTEVFAYFNNDFKTQAADNARALASSFS